MSDPRPGLRAAIAATLASAALVADQLRLGIPARTAEVSHLIAAPPLAVWIPAGALTLVALAIAVWGARVPRDVRLTRVPLLFLVLVLFVELFVLPPVRPLGASVDGAYAVHTCAKLVEARSRELGRLPTTAPEVLGALRELPPPPYLIPAAPIDGWQVVVRTGCSGPATDVAGLQAGTFVYCLSPDAKRAWITGVGLASALFGPPELLRHGNVILSEELPVPQPGDSSH